MTEKNTGVLETIKDELVAAIKGAGDVTAASMDAVTQIGHAAIRDTAKVGGDLGGTAVRLVEGAIDAAKELGVSAEEAASAAASGALKAADKVGGTAVQTVRHALTGTIRGIKVVLKEPFQPTGTK